MEKEGGRGRRGADWHSNCPSTGQDYLAPNPHCGEDKQELLERRLSPKYLSLFFFLKKNTLLYVYTFMHEKTWKRSLRTSRP